MSSTITLSKPVVNYKLSFELPNKSLSVINSTTNEDTLLTISILPTICTTTNHYIFITKLVSSVNLKEAMHNTVASTSLDFRQLQSVPKQSDSHRTIIVLHDNRHIMCLSQDLDGPDVLLTEKESKGTALNLELGSFDHDFVRLQVASRVDFSLLQMKRQSIGRLHIIVRHMDNVLELFGQDLLQQIYRLRIVDINLNSPMELTPKVDYLFLSSVILHRSFKVPNEVISINAQEVTGFGILALQNAPKLETLVLVDCSWVTNNAVMKVLSLLSHMAKKNIQASSLSIIKLLFKKNSKQVSQTSLNLDLTGMTQLKSLEVTGLIHENLDLSIPAQIKSLNLDFPNWQVQQDTILTNLNSLKISATYETMMFMSDPIDWSANIKFYFRVTVKDYHKKNSQLDMLCAKTAHLVSKKEEFTFDLVISNSFHTK